MTKEAKATLCCGPGRARAPIETRSAKPRPALAGRGFHLQTRIATSISNSGSQAPGGTALRSAVTCCPATVLPARHFRDDISDSIARGHRVRNDELLLEASCQYGHDASGRMQAKNFMGIIEIGLGMLPRMRNGNTA